MCWKQSLENPLGACFRCHVRLIVNILEVLDVEYFEVPDV